MATIFDGDLHAGISGLTLDGDVYELGEGIRLYRTYAYHFAPYMLAFDKPLKPGSIHPGPWKAVGGGKGITITAELYIPSETAKRFATNIGLACSILFLIRLGINPAVTMPVFANAPFNNLAHKSDVILEPFELDRPSFPLSVENGQLNDLVIGWIKNNWETTYRLTESQADFNLAVAALDEGQFIKQQSLVMVSLWAALEALFSPSTTELSFRVSALIAAFLEEPGLERLARQKIIAKLYTKRSAAAHGKPKHNDQDLLDSFNLLREVILKIIELGRVPSKEDLEAKLFGATEIIGHKENSRNG